MAESKESGRISVSLAKEVITAALLDITGDLDKAHVLQQQLPGWWMHAESGTRQALLAAQKNSQRPREQTEQLFKRLKPLKQFCAERLATWLRDKGHGALNVEHDTLEIPRRAFRISIPTGYMTDVVSIEKHSLLLAAMQNFPPANAESGGMPRGSVIRAGQNVVPGLSAEVFVGYCRELDLGGAYQRYLQEMFHLPVAGEDLAEADNGYSPAVNLVGRSRCMDMQIDLHIAYAKGDISQPTYVLLQALINADAPASEVEHLLFHGKPLAWQGLNIGGACLWGVLVFGNVSAVGLPQGPVVLYMPNEPVRPWFEYPSLADFKQYLTLKLQVRFYRQFFTGYLDASERVDFFQRFDPTRTLTGLEPVAQPGNLARFFFNSCTGKLLLEARTLAVPVAQVDEDARKRRLQNYLDAGLSLLTLASFVVPVIGQLMMGFGIGQLLGEVFEGIDDWDHDEKTEALGHLVSVAESIAGMALFAAGSKAFTALERTATGSAGFFDGVEAVQRPDASTRLWRREVGSYNQPHALVSNKVANPQGIYQVDGKFYVKVDDRLYAMAFDPIAKQWAAVHPQRSEAYRPPLKHNHAGGWRFAWERAHEWEEPAYMFTRLNPRLGAMRAEDLKDLSSVADLPLPRLRYLARHDLPLPERFNDSVVRFQQALKVHDLTAQLKDPQSIDASTARTQMLALPHMPGWPRGRFFEVLDSNGVLLERYPETAPFAYEDLSIHITEQQLEDGQVMPTLLAALDPEETRALLGAAVEPEEARTILAQRLLDSLEHSHRRVYEQLYREADAITHSDHSLLKAQHPSLPNRIAWELFSKAAIEQRWQLRKTGRVPLSLAQRTREALQTLEEDEALRGLFWPKLATEPTQRLAVGLLARVPGWPQDLALQVRRGTLGGALVAGVDGQTVPLLRTVVSAAEGFQAFDEHGEALGAMATGEEGFYQALLDTVSADQRALLKLDGPQGGNRLRYALLDQAEAQRKTLSRYLWPERVVPEAAEMCIQGLFQDGPQQPVTLMRKVGKLYPAMNPRELTLLLEDLGADHLSRARAVKALEQQFDLLHRTLKQWRDDRVALAKVPHPIADVRMSRHHAMEVIERCWRRLTLLPDEQGLKVPGLVLDGRVVGPLPILPAEVDFGHVRRLSLNRMELNDDVAYFLKHFKNLTSLEVRHNQLTRLPEVVSQMPELKGLYLDHNRLQLTQYSHAKLAAMQGLQCLNLSHNALVDPPPINRLFELRELMLRDCRLKTFPAGLLRLPYLDRVDLRGNDINVLPTWLAEAPRTVAETINLRGNPLNRASRELLRTYRSSTGVGMGFLEDDIAILNEQKARALWMVADETAERYLARQQTWAGLKDEPASEALFRLLAELGGTADAHLVREDMTRRVWRVLDAAQSDERLRAELFERAATPINCDDGAAASFSNLEVLVEVHNAGIRVEGGQLTAGPLLRLSKGLFRLDQLEQYARDHIAEHPTADPLEVDLAYRTGLADRFDLPGQPRHMRYARLGGVTAEALSVAENQLKAAEMSPQLLRYLVQLPLWSDYLKRIHAARFETLNEPFSQRMQTVFDRSSTLQDAAYRTQMEQVQGEQQAAETAVLEHLTSEALKQGDQLACPLP